MDCSCYLLVVEVESEDQKIRPFAVVEVVDLAKMTGVQKACKEVGLVHYWDHNYLFACCQVD